MKKFAAFFCLAFGLLFCVPLFSGCTDNNHNIDESMKSFYRIPNADEFNIFGNIIVNCEIESFDSITLFVRERRSDDVVGEVYFQEFPLVIDEFEGKTLLWIDFGFGTGVEAWKKYFSLSFEEMLEKTSPFMLFFQPLFEYSSLNFFINVETIEKLFGEELLSETTITVFEKVQKPSGFDECLIDVGSADFETDTDDWFAGDADDEDTEQKGLCFQQALINGYEWQAFAASLTDEKMIQTVSKLVLQLSKINVLIDEDAVRFEDATSNVVFEGTIVEENDDEMTVEGTDCTIVLEFTKSDNDLFESIKITGLEMPILEDVQFGEEFKSLEVTFSK